MCTTTDVHFNKPSFHILGLTVSFVITDVAWFILVAEEGDGQLELPS